MDFFYITVHEPQKFTWMTRKILADAQQYSFNYLNLKWFTTLVMIESLHDIKGASKHYYVFNPKGWAIILDQPGFVEVKYIFVYPEYRRTGFFTQLLTLIKRQNKEISVCTQESIMVRVLNAKGFQLKGPSLDGKELAFILPCE
jgi:GNAT superfamily N-acetyltransferase|tara:strand:- start:247 stop:678 length:432 start_codon:yes stop_codon:yes gene_type:complete